MAQDNSQLDPADTMAMVFMGVLILGSGAGATLAARFLTPVQQALLECGVLVPAGEAAFPLGETGLGVPLWVALTLVLVLVGGMGLMFYVFARKRAAQAQR
ncbi:hypothetical protein KM868_10975 [Micrococcus luteus]|uniref:hypothetical protein n=1 Tax=Micrococcus luteus TaxID=1270 RepID=UPI000E86E463|nr:hypothetical protein [Micrococcus luteus]MBU8764016.1 hypothetical protein [Micrococcus luteus]MCV7496503.1 hypothetical protein [Micrococcus luteus]MCV7548054.1 hypothetical protein [Micrococcus luteus]MPZ03186.1 hypothetical protein [Micrococcus luteus]HAY86209.1 hypothetical protein [Micrococcus luteus]